jgi:hypothetical protein
MIYGSNYLLPLLKVCILAVLFVNVCPVNAFSAAPNIYIKADPSTCAASNSHDLCPTVISWDSTGIPAAQIWLTENNKPPVQVACSVHGMLEFPWAKKGSVYQFDLYWADSCSRDDKVGQPLDSLIFGTSEAKEKTKESAVIIGWRQSSPAQTPAVTSVTSPTPTAVEPPTVNQPVTTAKFSLDYLPEASVPLPNDNRGIYYVSGLSSPQKYNACANVYTPQAQQQAKVVFNVKDYGAIGDGQNHLAGRRFPGLECPHCSNQGKQALANLNY